MLKNFTKIGKDNRGISLLEMMIAISLFAIVITAAINLFSSLIKTQKALLDKAYVLNSLSYTMEYMSKAIRMAQKDTGGSCIGNNENFNFIMNGNGLKFLSYNGQCQTFFLSNFAILVRKDGGGGNTPALALTPSNITVEDLRFNLIGQSQGDLKQPRVSFLIKAKAAGSSAGSFIIQTTVSQRALDRAY